MEINGVGSNLGQFSSQQYEFGLNRSNPKNINQHKKKEIKKTGKD